MENPTFNIILYIAGGVITLSSAIGIITKLFKKSVIGVSKNLIRETNDNYTQIVNLTTKDIKETLDTFIAASNEHDALIEAALMNLARDRINQAYSFYMNEGEIGEHSLFTLEELYKNYTQLGGNSHTHTQMEQLRKLRIRRS